MAFPPSADPIPKSFHSRAAIHARPRVRDWEQSCSAPKNGFDERNRLARLLFSAAGLYLLRL